MYDNNISSRKYNQIKDTISDIISGADTKTDVEELAEHIQELYNNSELSSSMYDNLMSYIQDLLI